MAFTAPNPNTILQKGNTENLSPNQNKIPLDYFGTDEEVQPEIQKIKPKFDKTASLPRPLSHPNEGKLEKIGGKDVWVFPTGLQTETPWVPYDALYLGGTEKTAEGQTYKLTVREVFPPPHSLSTPEEVVPSKWKFEPHNLIEIEIRRKKAGAGFMEGEIWVDGERFCYCLEKTVNNSLLTAGAVGVDVEHDAESTVFVDLQEGVYSASVAFNEYRNAWLLKMESSEEEDGAELAPNQHYWFLGDRKPHPATSLISIGKFTQAKEQASDPYKINSVIGMLTTDTFELVEEPSAFKTVITRFRHQAAENQEEQPPPKIPEDASPEEIKRIMEEAAEKAKEAAVQNNTNPISLLGEYDGRNRSCGI